MFDRMQGRRHKAGERGEPVVIPAPGSPAAKRRHLAGERPALRDLAPGDPAHRRRHKAGERGDDNETE